MDIVKGTKVYECGICSAYHPWEWAGDCREDINRFADAEDYAKKTDQEEIDIEVLSMSDRVREDCEI